MMKYYFESKENQERLKKVLDEWVGTPYRHHCAVKGLGADCIHFVVAVLEEMGLLKIRKGLIPHYPKDWHLHNTRELLKEGVERELKGEWVDLGDFKNGDIILCHYGQASSHSTIYFDGYGYQALESAGVCKIIITDPDLRGRMRFAYRLIV